MKTSRPFWLARLAVLALALSVVAACDDNDTTGPGAGALDPVSASVTMDSIFANFFEGNEAINSLDVFRVLIGAQLGISPALLTVDPELGTFESLMRGARIGAEAFRASSTSDAPRAARIPPILKGVTLVYNPATGQYEPDPQRTGAPVDGVRFILYAVDPILGQPISPLTEIGWIDIVDRSANLVINVSLTAVVGGDTLIDINVTGSGTSDTDFNLMVNGFVSDGTDRLTYEFDVSNSTSGATASFILTHQNLRVNFALSEDPAGGGSITVTISNTATSESITFQMNVDAADNVLAGSGITLGDGTVVANISGTAANPVITNAAGDPLTPAELAALGDLFTTIEDIFGVVEDLFGFALFVVGLGVL